VSEQIRFHLDEHIDSNIARGLRRYGIDVTTTVDAGLRTKSDESHLEFIRFDRRVIVTHDDDFLIMASDTTDYPGIVYCPPNSRSVGEIIRSLILIYEVYTPEEMSGRIEYI
jgi:predicted nuclease of predicted toxin-antitoxin system